VSALSGYNRAGIYLIFALSVMVYLMSVKNTTYHQFLVDEVVPVRTAKPTINTFAALNLRLGSADDRVSVKSQSILHCSDSSSIVIEGIDYHPFIASVHLAFAEHRPLVLSPDMIWTAILQGLAHHTHCHTEELR
jgi:hypothetical protein